MILVDSQIKALINKDMLIKEGYNPDNVNSMSYDLTIDKVLISQENDEMKEIDSFKLEPGQFVYIKTKETLRIPNNILGRIAQKNSIMRMGLVVDGLHYQPGHITKSFLRVQNISQDSIRIYNKMKIAQIIFEELAKEPDIPYSQQENASFNEEFTYKGFGKYESQYNRAINKIKKLNDALDEKENRIYGNIVTFMGIFITIFSIITINFELFSEKNLTIAELTKSMVIINLSLGLVITFLMAIVAFIINKVRQKVYIVIALIIIILLAFLNVLFWIPKVETPINNYNIIESIVEQSDITVMRLQQLLKDNGYDLETTGEMDKNTYEAINNYKIENNITTNSLIELIGLLQR